MLSKKKQGAKQYVEYAFIGDKKENACTHTLSLKKTAVQEAGCLAQLKS